jgi:hypothetical protein
VKSVRQKAESLKQKAESKKQKAIEAIDISEECYIR